MQALKAFELIVRSASQFSSAENSGTSVHPFEVRNVLPSLPPEVRSLFDDGHYSQATFEAYKYLDNVVGRYAPNTQSGRDRMMKAFKEDAPLIHLTQCSTQTEINEQEGYKFLFAGAMIAVRNPRGHDHSIHDSVDECLDHLALVSLLLRRLATAGYR